MSLNNYKRPQYKRHREELQKRRISLAEARERGYTFLTADEMRRQTGKECAAIGIPYVSIDGKDQKHVRWKLLDPDPEIFKKQKYHQRGGTGVKLYYGQFGKTQKRNWRVRRKKANSRYLITEGEFKADEAARAGYYCISVPGVSSFKNSDGTLHDEFKALNFDNATFEFWYDTDQNTKTQVWRDQLALVDLLVAHAKREGHEIAIKFGSLTPVPNEPKTGLDDYLLHYGKETFATAPRHDLDSEYIKYWRQKVAEFSAELPESLRNLQPFDSSWYDSAPPPIEWVVEGLLQEGESALVVGPGSAGKTYMLLNMTVAVATGRSFFGLKAPKKRRVMYVMLERHKNSFRRRWHKVAHSMVDAIDEKGTRARFIKDLKANAYLHAMAGETFNLIQFKQNQWSISPAVDALIAELQAARIELLILDPYSRLHGGNESDNTVGAVITKALERIMSAVGCSVVLVHHTGKNERGDQYSGRGASSLNDNTSECIVLGVVDGQARKNLDLSALTEEEMAARADIVCIQHSRASDGPRMRDFYLVRNPKSGLLRRISTGYKSPEQILEELIGADSNLRKWADGLEFTRTKFVNARKEIVTSADMSERHAAELFDAGVAAGIFEPVLDENGKPKKPRGGQLYRLHEPSDSVSQSRSASAGPQSSAPLAKRSKKRRHRRAEKRR